MMRPQRSDAGSRSVGRFSTLTRIPVNVTNEPWALFFPKPTAQQMMMAQVKSTKAKLYFIVNLWLICHHYLVKSVIGEYEHLGNRPCGREG